jgi:flagella basal body P-ring formation protein FlgA
MNPCSIRRLLLFALFALVPSTMVQGALPPVAEGLIDALLEAEWGPGNSTWELSGNHRMEIPEGANLVLESGPLPRGITLMNLAVYDGEELVRRIPISLRVTAWALAPIATRRLDNHHEIAHTDLTWERIDVTSLRTGWPRSADELAATTYWMRRRIEEGEPVTWRDIQARPAVVRGDEVTLIAETGGVRIVTNAVAMEHGATGQVIRVENEEYSSILRARVAGQATVIAIGPSR